jgi:hypothetical protein
MSNGDDGGPAFPIMRPTDPRIEYCDQGMTLRDWFAAQPDITGSTLMIAKEQGEALAGPRPDDPLGSYKWQCQVLAALRYIAADAMIAARKGGAA